MSDATRNEAVPTRRDFVKAAGAAVLSTSYAAMGQPAPPSRLRTKNLLTREDFQYEGMFRLPYDPPGVRFGWSTGALAARRVNDQLRFFITGAEPSGDPVYEITYPGHGRTFDTSPRASVVHLWGDIYGGKKVTFRGGGVTRGLFWFDDRLWWSYGDIYNASSSSWDPSLGSTVLPANGGNIAAYGPWRTQEHSQRTRGYMLELPADFAALHTSGRRLAIGAPITSGNVQSPWGAMLSAIPALSTTRPSDPLQSQPAHGNEQWSVACQVLLKHDISHRQARDTRYKMCGWNQQYDCGGGSWVTPGTPQFTDIDMMSAATWIDLPDKQGLVYFGQLATALDGTTYANDTVPHVWYGPDTCCHGQSGRPLWAATGPGTPTSVPHIWIYDPDDIAAVARGQKNAYALTPTSTFPTHTFTDLSSSVGLYYFGGAYFDHATRLLFVSTTYDDRSTNSYEPRPIIRVFKIKT